MSEDLALQELIKAFELIDPPKIIEYEYRLYYNHEGIVYRTTNLKSDPIEGKNYILVDETIHKNYTRYRIINGEPVLIPQSTYIASKLVQSDTGVAVVQNHANLPLIDQEEFEQIEYYDYKNSRHS